MNRHFPVQISTDVEDNIVRVNLVNDWYDKLLPVYKALEEGRKFGAIQYQGLKELVEYLNMEFGVLGITLTVSIFGFLTHLAARNIEVGKAVMLSGSFSGSATLSGSLTVE